MSYRHLRQALEAYDVSPEAPAVAAATIELRGPLSDVYSKALQEVFKRVVPGNDPTDRDVQISEETAANDELMLQELARSLSTTSSPATNSSVLYGVSRSEVSPADVVNVSQQYSDNPDTPVIVIVDGTDAGPNSPVDSEPTLKLKSLETAMESICVASGGGLYRSLTEYARSRVSKIVLN